MNFNRRIPEEPQINLTSLIDVVFLLLIFFMVTTTFVRSSGLDIKLPEAGDKTPAAQTQTLDAVVDSRGAVYIGGRQVSTDPASLRVALEGLADGDFDQPLRLRADGRASHESVVQVMDAAASLGFSRVDIATQRVEEGRK